MVILEITIGIRNLKPTYLVAWLILERMSGCFMKNVACRINILCNNNYVIYIIRMISWIIIGMYAYFGFSNLEYFTEHSFLSIILLFAIWGTDYKVRYSKTSFFKRFCEVLLHLVLVCLLIFAMYLLTT